MAAGAWLSKSQGPQGLGKGAFSSCPCVPVVTVVPFFPSTYCMDSLADSLAEGGWARCGGRNAICYGRLWREQNLQGIALTRSVLAPCSLAAPIASPVLFPHFMARVANGGGLRKGRIMAFRL
jgi:hypothetical protein